MKKTEKTRITSQHLPLQLFRLTVVLLSMNPRPFAHKHQVMAHIDLQHAHTRQHLMRPVLSSLPHTIPRLSSPSLPQLQFHFHLLHHDKASHSRHYSASGTSRTVSVPRLRYPTFSRSSSRYQRYHHLVIDRDHIVPSSTRPASSLDQFADCSSACILVKI